MTVTEKTHQPRQAQRAGPSGRHPARRQILRHRRRVRPSAVLAAALAVLFFFGPAFARLAGVQPTRIENRPLRPFPSAAKGWQFLPGLDGWAVDHLPLRDVAVRANGWVSEHVFRELSTRDSGSQAVLAGRDGWLFYREDMERRCAPAQPLQATLGQLDRLGRLITGLGREFVVTVPPDKSTIETAMLPRDYPSRACAEAAGRAFWDQIGAAPPAGYLDLNAPIASVAKQQGHAYYTTDTHWAPAATAAYARTLMSRLDPAVLDSTTFTTSGSQIKTTDLTKMIGMPKTERAPAVQVRRDGVTVHRVSQPRQGYPAGHSTATTTGAPLDRTPTLILGDSFTEESMAVLAPFFTDLTFVHWDLALADPAATARLILGARTVVVEAVQREFEGGAVPLLVAPMLDALAAHLPAPTAHP
ncbi:alginate O-acetyltransferase AlgX-related protein [Rugosimonospora africana]|uniref:AlgX/AlgJ SGNH hydrolase-like domain-containing protein n=1 Tax=Rugosimonospora africana TaxID=556532 RepID=A0A8J3VQ39_9ACTN|nr:hypothetical protein [Rugosimonospora africana]GIH14740.1 hypothetical protein Raf01_29120 [Rugosimonospora africana]